jgi:hypothetical protein
MHQPHHSSTALPTMLQCCPLTAAPAKGQTGKKPSTPACSREPYLRMTDVLQPGGNDLSQVQSTSSAPPSVRPSIGRTFWLRSLSVTLYVCQRDDGTRQAQACYPSVRLSVCLSVCLSVMEVMAPGRLEVTILSVCPPFPFVRTHACVAAPVSSVAAVDVMAPSALTTPRAEPASSGAPLLPLPAATTADSAVMTSFVCCVSCVCCQRTQAHRLAAWLTE